jgi:hypothetical protein
MRTKLNFSNSLIPKLCATVCVIFITLTGADAQSNAVQDIIDGLCPCNGPAAGEWKNHGDYVSCVTKAVNDLRKKGKLTGSQGGKIISAAANSTCGKLSEETGEEAEGSPGIISISGVSETSFNPRNSKVTFNLSNATFSPDPQNYRVYVNEQDVTVLNLTITANSVAFDISLYEGRNDFLFTASDNNGLALAGEYTLWAGSQTLPVTVVDENNTMVSDATVKLSLSDDPLVAVEATTQSGSAVFQNIPQRTIIASVSTPDKRFGTAATVPIGDILTVKLLSIKPVSATKNLDFNVGTTGWDLSSGAVQLIPHIEDINSTDPASTLKSSTQFNIAETNNDFQLSTTGEGPSMTSHVFIPLVGTKSVAVRYRFVTSEIPGGYFGSEYNDYFSINIYGQKSGISESETNSMNGLGLASFNYSTGTTAWREVTFPISMAGDIIQVDVVVANVGDGLYDSQIVVDFVEERDLEISKLTLRDIDQSILEYLSLGDGHSYTGGKTQVFGTIEVLGDVQDGLSSLELEVLKDGQLVTTGALASTAASILLQPFGSDGKVAITTPVHLFDIPAIPSYHENGSVQLRVQAKTTSGQSDTEEYKTLPYLAIYPPAYNRYSSKRDEVQGGDSWALPSTVNFALNQPTWTFNDFSNMNGGLFIGTDGDKPHVEHQWGTDIDFRCPNFEHADVNLANTLIDFLRSSAGSQTQYIYVTYSEVATPEFYNAIKDVTIPNLGNKLVTEIILNKANHKAGDHFHIRLRQGVPSATAKMASAEFTRRGPRNEPDKSDKSLDNLIFLSSVSPNPITFSENQAHVQIKNSPQGNLRAILYDVNGTPVKELYNQADADNQIDLTWDGSDEKGVRLKSGIYFIKITDSTGKNIVHRLLVR